MIRRRFGRAARFPAVAYEARGVLAGRYRGKDIGDRTLLTHGLSVDATGNTDTKSLCRRVEEEGLSDMAADAVTCPLCLERIAKRGLVRRDPA